MSYFTDHPSPLVRIRLSQEHLGLRVTLVVIALAAAILFFATGILDAQKTPPGWQEISPTGAALSGRGKEFLFQYEVSGDVEMKALTAEYSAILQEAFTLFGDDCLDPLNSRPNQTAELSPELYEALETLSGTRYLFYAPIYEQYRGLYNSAEDSEADQFDPAVNAEVLAYLAETTAFCADPQAVSLELRGEHQAVLHVSEEYLSYAVENEITQFLDFFWLKNALIADFTAQKLIAAGYTKGTLSSYDGFSQTLGPGAYALDLSVLREGRVYPAYTLRYEGPMALVSFRAYPANSLDELHYYIRADGRISTPFIDPATCRNAAAAESLTALNTKGSCLEAAMELLPLYQSDRLDEAALAETGIDAVWLTETGWSATNPNISVTPVS